MSRRGYQGYKTTWLMKIEYLNFVAIGDAN